MDVRDLRGKTALVTGAGSGIGRATALAFAQRGARLIVCDIDPDGLAHAESEMRAAGAEVCARQVDVSNKEDILMNNAGVGLGARFLDTTLPDWEWIIGINLWGVIYGCHFFVPAMVARGSGGHVINVSSAAGYVASQNLCAYATTKFGVFGLSEALRQELAPHGIGVTAVCPGIINTRITETSRLRGAAATPEARRAIVDMYRRRNYGPERVAKNILKAVQRNRAVAPISPEAWAMYYLKRLSPVAVSFLNRRADARMQRRIGMATTTHS